jgi:hypothetical protein
MYRRDLREGAPAAAQAAPARISSATDIGAAIAAAALATGAADALERIVAHLSEVNAPLVSRLGW